MRVEEDVRAMVARVAEHYGRIDILVNCAGRGYDAPVEHTDIETFREIFQLDVVGPLVAMQAVIPIMRRQGGGTIVNVSSGTSLMNLPNMSPYSSLKRALNALSLAAREELKTRQHRRQRGLPVHDGHRLRGEYDQGQPRRVGRGRRGRSSAAGPAGARGRQDTGSDRD